MNNYLSQLANSLTGNVFLDTLIVAHILPFITSYINKIVSLVGHIIYVICEIIYGLIRQHFSKKILGKNVIYIKIEENDPLYIFLKSNVFIKSIHSDTINDKINIWNNLLDLLNIKKENEKSYWKAYQKYNRDTYRVVLGYEKEDGLNYYKDHLYQINKLIKYFQHENIRYTMSYITPKESENKDICHKSMIKVKINSHTNNSSSESKNIDWHLKHFYKFLDERFEMEKKIYYTYNIEIDKNIITHFATYLNNPYYDLKGPGHLINDMDTDLNTIKNIESNISNKYQISINCDKFFNLNTKYSNYMEMDSKSEKDSITEMTNYLKKVLDYRLNITQYWSLIEFDNMFIGIKRDGGSNSGILGIAIKGKKLFPEEIKNIIEILIRLGITRNNKIEKTNKKNISINRYKNGKWSAIELTKRSLDTIYLPRKLKKEIENEIRAFISKKELYEEYQIPYKKGMLFYGPPGTGKTSLVKAIASEFAFNIYLLNINDPEINDDSINDILNSIGGSGQKILLFEDIDSAFAEKEKLIFNSRKIKNVDISSIDQSKSNNDDILIAGNDKKTSTNIVTETNLKNGLYDGMRSKAEPNVKYLTYSGLLNGLDGVMSNNFGIITIMTTNYIDKLGDAFLRPGRIDCKFELKECNDEQIYDMIFSLIKRKNNIIVEKNDHHYIDILLIKDKINILIGKLVDNNGMSKIKPCQLQFYILKYIDDIESIFNNYHELL